MMRTGCAIATGIKLRSAGQCGRRSCLWKKPKTRSDGLDALREVMSLRDIAGYIERLPASKQMLDARKSLSRSREARTKHVYTDPYQAALLKTFFMPACIGAAISVVSFCAMPVRCRACSANASACLRACSADNSTNADGDFTPST